jgi:UDP-N-acetylglucosamine diphosphorylase / glucose-1-phosphate thymidylyltransferase / UDP-N-acetylgalactosamine diphosphorylase / glucosamine-1-phosphate N-acetyltransferase / galactosamine-1-phosphate N-acetyltransferase
MSVPLFAPADFFDLKQTDHAAIFDGVTHAWEILSKLGKYLEEHIEPGNHGTVIGQPVIGEKVFIGEGTVIEPGAYIKGPAWIGANCQIRHGAYIRENVIVGAGSVVGNSCELKNSFLFNGCQVPHFNYVGDSILGAKAHLAAGVIVSNLKLNGDFITLQVGHHVVATGLRKFGAIIGDGAEIGCNAVINPGAIIGRKSLIYPGVSWRGILPANSIAKTHDCVRERRGETPSSLKSKII